MSEMELAKLLFKFINICCLSFFFTLTYHNVTVCTSVPEFLIDVLCEFDKTKLYSGNKDQNTEIFLTNMKKTLISLACKITKDLFLLSLKFCGSLAGKFAGNLFIFGDHRQYQYTIVLFHLIFSVCPGLFL